MFYVKLHGAYKDAMPKGHKGRFPVYANTINEVLSFLKQFPDCWQLLDSTSFEIKVGKSTLKDTKGITAEQAGDPKWQIPDGATLHFTPHLGGHEITTAMIITALITAAITIAVTFVMMLLFPPPSPGKNKKDRKSTLYEGGLNTQTEGVPLNYVAGLDYLCGGNIIEGDVEYVRTGGTGAITSISDVFAAMKSGGGQLYSNTPSVSYDDINVAVANTVDGAGGGKGGGGGKTIRNTIVTDATVRVLMAYSSGPVGGIVGTTYQEKCKNIYINEMPLIDHGNSQQLFQGFTWEERKGEVGQAPIAVCPNIANNHDRSINLPKALIAGGSQFYHEELVSDVKVKRVKVRIRVNGLVKTDKEGNQQSTNIQVGLDVKRENAVSWTTGGSLTYTGKSSEPFVLEKLVSQPSAGAPGEKWMFRVYRITEDSTSDKLTNPTQFNGFVEYQDVEFKYDGTEGSASGVPVALFGLAIDLSQFDQGGQLPSLAVRAAGRKVRVPTNYNPTTRAYTGVWNGLYKLEATQNPVWHWLELATNKKVGAGIPDDFFDKFSLYETAQFCDGNVNGRPRYTLNTQFTDAKPGWEFLSDLASSFRAFPYYDGNRIVLVQDRPQAAPDHYVNNACVADGFFNYKSVPIEDQFNEVKVEWEDPNDFFRTHVEIYRDEVAIATNNINGLANNGVISQTFDKIGCTNRQEAYDLARLLTYVSQHENETVQFKTLVAAAAYAPGQLIAIDDWVLSGKKQHGRVLDVTPVDGEGDPITDTVRLDQTVIFNAAKTYNAYCVIGNKLVIRPIIHTGTGTYETDLIKVSDTTGMFDTMPMGVIQADGVQPRWFRIMDIQDAGGGEYQVTAKLHVEGKHAWVEQNVPVPTYPYSVYKPNKTIPVPTINGVTPSFEMNPILGPMHHLTLSWEPINDPELMLQGFVVEVFKPDGMWHLLYEGPQTVCTLSNAVPGDYVFTVKAVNTFNRSSGVATYAYRFLLGEGDAPLLPPTFLGFR